MKRVLSVTVVLVLVIVGAFLIVGNADAKPGNGQETCAKSDGWVKYDGLSGHEFNYPGEVPEGATVENCVKYATTVRYGTGVTVVSDGKHEISHASFRITTTVPHDECPDVPGNQPEGTDCNPVIEPPKCGDEGYVPVGDECEEEEPPRDRPDLCDRPVIGGPCAPLDEPEIGTPEVEVRNPDKSKNTDALPNTGA